MRARSACLSRRPRSRAPRLRCSAAWTPGLPRQGTPPPPHPPPQPGHAATVNHEKSLYTGDQQRIATQKMHGSHSLVGQCQRGPPMRSDLSHLLALRDDSCQQLTATLYQLKRFFIHGPSCSLGSNCSLSLANSARLTENNFDLDCALLRNNIAISVPSTKNRIHSPPSTAKRQSSQNSTRMKTVSNSTPMPKQNSAHK